LRPRNSENRMTKSEIPRRGTNDEIQGGFHRCASVFQIWSFFRHSSFKLWVCGTWTETLTPSDSSRRLVCEEANYLLWVHSRNVGKQRLTNISGARSCAPIGTRSAPGRSDPEANRGCRLLGSGQPARAGRGGISFDVTTFQYLDCSRSVWPDARGWMPDSAFA